MSLLVADNTQNISVADALEGLSPAGRYAYLVAWLGSLNPPGDGIPSDRLTDLLHALAVNPFFDSNATRALIDAKRDLRHLSPLDTIHDSLPTGISCGSVAIKRFAGGQFRNSIEVPEDRHVSEIELLASGAEQWYKAGHAFEAALPRYGANDCVREKFAVVQSLVLEKSLDSLACVEALASKCKLLATTPSFNPLSGYFQTRDPLDPSKRSALLPTTGLYWANSLDHWSDSWAGTLYDCVLWIVLAFVLGSGNPEVKRAWLADGHPVKDILNALPRWRLFLERWPHDVQPELGILERAVRIDPLVNAMAPSFEERLTKAFVASVCPSINAFDYSTLMNVVSLPGGNIQVPLPDTHYCADAKLMRKRTSNLRDLAESVVDEATQKKKMLQDKSAIADLMRCLTANDFRCSAYKNLA